MAESEGERGKVLLQHQVSQSKPADLFSQRVTEALVRAIRVARLHDKAVCALDLHAIVELALKA